MCCRTHFDGCADWNQGYRDRIHMPRRQVFMTKIYDVIMNCLISAAILFSFHYVVISLVVHYTE